MKEKIRALCKGDHVRVTTKLVELHGKVEPDDGDTLRPHPHAGKTGIITELLGVRLTGPGWKPRAMVRIDVGQEDAGNFMVVSLKYLEPVK
jgi:hypothetical protein